jgi:hypothetical protein
MIAGLSVLFIGLIVKEILDNKGRRHLHDRINGLDDKFVNTKHCHTAMNGIREIYKQERKHVDERFDDLKDFIKKNGGAGKG